MSDLVRVSEILLEKTTEGLIEWESLSEDEYFTDVGGKTINLRKIRNRTNSVVYVIDIADESGNIVDRNVQSSGTGGVNQRLHNIARRKALRIDETLSAIEAALKSL